MNTKNRLKLIVLTLLAAVAMTGICTAENGPTGTLTGMLYDSAAGNPVSGATISAGNSPAFQAISNADGAFRLELEPGVYTLRITKEKYMPVTLSDLVVIAGQVTDATTVLAPASEVTTVDVVGATVQPTATATSLITERQLSETVQDSISGSEISMMAASNAGAALEKVTGVSVIGERYVYVRGLGERYSTTSLNGATLATTEPERRVVPLDLFPSSLLDNVRVTKSYSPDQPGEFAGGVVNVETTAFPTHPLLEVSMKVGFNTNTTGKPFLTYPGGGLDWAGFDDGTRDIPAVIPLDERATRGNIELLDLQEMGRAFPTNWELTPASSARPNQSYSVVAGNTWGRLGLVGAISFSNDLQTLNEVRNTYRIASGDRLTVFNNFDPYRVGAENATLGGILNLTYQLTPANTISWRNFLSRDSQKSGRDFQGWNSDFAQVIRHQRLRWVERSLSSTQIEGKHVLAGFGNSILDWRLNYSRGRRNEPDLTEIMFFQEADGEYVFKNETQSALRMYNYLNDRIWEPSIDFLRPFFTGSLTGSVKIGFSSTFRNRDFVNKRYRFFPVSMRGIDPRQPPNDLLSKPNIRPNGFELREETRNTDAYNARQRIYGGYVMTDLTLSPRWRVSGGVRIENSFQEVLNIDQFHPEHVPTKSVLDNTDPLPAINVICLLRPKMNLRFGFSKTVNRPDFRELAKFDFTDVVGGRTVIGNPELVRAKVRNLDVRWEWFPGGEQVVAASFFYKRFQDPIERTIQPTVGLRTSYENVGSADNYGVELEARRNLSFLTDRLHEFSTTVNFTFVDSNVEIDPSSSNVVTSLSRPLAGQARYVANVTAEWNRPKWRSNTRLYFNSTSSRLTDVGALGLPDVYQEQLNSLDLVYQFNVTETGRWLIRFTAENLTDHTYSWTQGGKPFRRYAPGRSFTIGTSFQIF